jgi:hypothetical protein
MTVSDVALLIPGTISALHGKARGVFSVFVAVGLVVGGLNVDVSDGEVVIVGASVAVNELVAVNVSVGVLVDVLVSVGVSVAVLVSEAVGVSLV